MEQVTEEYESKNREEVLDSGKRDMGRCVWDVVSPQDLYSGKLSR